jgi:hypothetical protein
MNEQLADQQLECVDCGQTFDWTVPEQNFYAERNFSAPRRCKFCREARRAQRAQAQQ